MRPVVVQGHQVFYYAVWHASSTNSQGGAISVLETEGGHLTHSTDDVTFQDVPESRFFDRIELWQLRRLGYPPALTGPYIERLKADIQRLGDHDWNKAVTLLAKATPSPEPKP